MATFLYSLMLIFLGASLGIVAGVYLTLREQEQRAHRPKLYDREREERVGS